MPTTATTTLPDEQAPTLGNGVKDEVAVTRAQVTNNGDIRYQLRRTEDDTANWEDAGSFQQFIGAFDTTSFEFVGLLDGEQYEVVDVDHGEPTARILVEKRRTGHYTQTLSQKRISDLRPETSRDLGDGYRLWFGRADVEISYDQYLVHDISTGEVESGPHPTGSPPLSLDTELMWVSLPEGHLGEIVTGLDVPLLEPTRHAEQDTGLTEPARYTYAGGIHAAEHGVIQLAPLELLIDNSDIGGLSMLAHRDDRIPGPVWFVHDGIDGGIGFSRAIYDNFEDIAERTFDHLETCDCQRRRGCPLCIMSEHCGNQNDPLDRVVGRQILGDVIDQL